MLTAGTKLGPYEIQSPIGAGGMGEVYRERDTKLGRDVALKFCLRRHLTSNGPQFRFAQEFPLSEVGPEDKLQVAKYSTE